MDSISLPFWLQIVVLIGLPIIGMILGNYAMPRLRSAQAGLDEASAAEIVQRLAKKALGDMVKRVKVLEASDKKKSRLIEKLDEDLVDERGKRRELERGVGILVAQLTLAGIKPKWQPPIYKHAQRR